MKLSRALLLLPALGLALVAAGCGGESAVSVPADAVAVVDDTPVSQKTLAELMKRAKVTYEAQQRDFPKAGTSEYQALQQQAVAFLVKRVENEKEAQALGIEVTPKEVGARLAEIRKQYFSSNQKKFLTELEEQGLSLASLREEVRATLVAEELYDEVTAGVKVTPEEVREYYDKNKPTYTVAASRDVRHILVPKKALAADLRSQLADGADFAALVKKYSTDTGSKSTGGKYTMTKGQMVANFEKAAFALDTDEISQPVKTQFGWHIIQALTDLKPASVTPFAKVEAEITSQLSEQKKNEAMVKWDDELARKYEDSVAYASGYEPPAAATTPTTTADES